jgi:hypothetical protein
MSEENPLEPIIRLVPVDDTDNDPSLPQLKTGGMVFYPWGQQLRAEAENLTD